MATGDAGVTSERGNASPALTETCLAAACLQAEMRAARFLGLSAALLVAIATNAPTAAADAALRSALGSQLAPAGSRAGAHVVDLNTGQVLFSRRADRRLVPASNEKIYTTGTALLRFGTGGRLRTTVLSTTSPDPTGALVGYLYLRGGGDPTFGSASYVADNYGTGATVESLARALYNAGLRSA